MRTLVLFLALVIATKAPGARGGREFWRRRGRRALRHY